jgi:NAD(P)H-dependent FMN reductase
VSDYNLPVFDEPVVPAMVPASAQFTKPHTLAWTGEIAKYDGYVLVIPEYNYGMAGGTKNAIDYLYNEWIGKPAVVVSYGIQGGTIASEQVKTALEGMKLRVAATRPALAFARGMEGGDGYAAIGKGELGEETRKAWEEKKETVLKAFGELKELLEEAPKKEEKA